MFFILLQAQVPVDRLVFMLFVCLAGQFCHSILFPIVKFEQRVVRSVFVEFRVFEHATRALDPVLLVHIIATITP